jgi:predicted nucleic acid-binding protein
MSGWTMRTEASTGRVIVDTSVWVHFDRGDDHPAALRLRGLIADTDRVAVTEPVIMELLAGARSDADRDRIARLLGRFALVRFDAVADFHAAATLYRLCRRNGVTPRGLVDCMIASVALRSGSRLLAADGDFDRMGQALGLVGFGSL